MLFDIHLHQGCWTAAAPDVDDLSERIPALRDEDLRARVRQWRPGGFLGLDIPEPEATELLDRLKRAEARGEVVPAAYREPVVTVEAARPIAERAIAEERQAHFPTYAFGPVEYARQGPRWWTFVSGSERLQQEGRIPGALFASVDKLDGHVWQPSEMEQLYEGR